jgi:hypothetical protein
MTALAGGCNTPFVAKAVVGSHVTEWASDGWLLPALSAFTPNVVLVSLGANDFGRNDPSNVQAGVTSLVAKIRAAGARVLWISPLKEPFMDTVGALSMWKAAVGTDWFDSSLLTLPRSGDGIHSTPAGYATWAADLWHWASGVIGAVAMGAEPWWRDRMARDVRDLMSGVTTPDGPAVPREWLKKRMSFAEAEAEMDEEARRVRRLPGAGRIPPLPPVATEERWLSLKSGPCPATSSGASTARPHAGRPSRDGAATPSCAAG